MRSKKKSESNGVKFRGIAKANGVPRIEGRTHRGGSPKVDAARKLRQEATRPNGLIGRKARSKQLAKRMRGRGRGTRTSEKRPEHEKKR